MMKNGLLHNPPEMIKNNFGNLFLDIELCVHSENKVDRFKLSDNILTNLRHILKKFTKILIG